MSRKYAPKKNCFSIEHFRNLFFLERSRKLKSFFLEKIRSRRIEIRKKKFEPFEELSSIFLQIFLSFPIFFFKTFPKAFQHSRRYKFKGNKSSTSRSQNCQQCVIKVNPLRSISTLFIYSLIITENIGSIRLEKSVS